MRDRPPTFSASGRRQARPTATNLGTSSSAIAAANSHVMRTESKVGQSGNN